MGKLSSYVLKGLMLVTLFGVVGLGTAKADPTCTANTLAYYVANYLGGCTYDGLTFSGFGAGATGVTGSSLGTAFLEVIPIIGVDGAGLEFESASLYGGGPNTWIASSGYELDAEVPFEVSCASTSPNCITDLYLQMTGGSNAAPYSAGTSNGDIVTESYCGGAPPPFPPSCGSQESLSIVNSSGTVTAPLVNFAGGISELSVGKDMGALNNEPNAPQGSSVYITDVINEFSTSTPPPTTPEPSSLLMLGAGLASLLGYGLRRRGNVQ